MTDGQAQLLNAIRNAHRFAMLIAGLQAGTTLTPVLQDRARREEEMLLRCVRYLETAFARGDLLTPPQPNDKIPPADGK